MSRSILDNELQELDAHILRLGTMVDEGLKRVLEALAAGDVAKAGMVIENDALVDSLRTAIEERAIRLLTLQQPLGGRDLRYLASVLSIAGDLERTGDGAAGIAQNILRMTPLRGDPMPHVKIETASMKDASSGNTITEASIMKDMLVLGKEARRVLQGTMNAFKDRDVKAARYIWEEDDVVDVRYHMVRHDLMAMMAGAHAIPALCNDSLILQRITYLLWMAHKLERVGDHCANVCERLLFIVEGDSYVQHLPQQNKGIQPQA
ncbi:phosphate transport system regulatory protein PhoU [Ktedonobacter sp. SOSP1-52]|uniref:phosphate signaling complex PhoU family protein n=1 Tax=Ktedonobacter sp. SOSP1-52 TaxID=2778366 RepID=UPI0019162488|nr:PhoU domain-containing protein [Ktedonobacter sp. SOSP1-52]GHO63664.1 phosphate transport system regulatory protein PhoU [Ktedonobacter sp. SOSP1-52]